MSKQAELTKRGAAGLAAQTKGRSRVMRDRTKYTRRTRTKKGED